MRKLVFIAFLVFLACNKDDPKPPSAASLVFPEQNSECTTGVDVTATTSRVEVRWLAGNNTDSYRVEITNLISNTTQVATSASTSVVVTLQKGQPYSWKVISLNNQTNEQAMSATWLFYNAGSDTTYAPFPAQILSPGSGATVRLENGQTVLSWMGADVDSDIESFEVFLDMNNPPITSQGTLGSNEQELTVNLDPATVYFWNVITLDREGNQSDSGIYSFRTQ